MGENLQTETRAVEPAAVHRALSPCCCGAGAAARGPGEDVAGPRSLRAVG